MEEKIIERLKNMIESNNEEIEVQKGRIRFYRRQTPSAYGGPSHDVKRGMEFINKTIEMFENKIRLLELDNVSLCDEIKFLKEKVEAGLDE
jgi:hypothetical protein